MVPLASSLMEIQSSYPLPSPAHPFFPPAFSDKNPPSDMQAVVPALSDWLIIIMVMGPRCNPEGPPSDTTFLFPGVLRLHQEGMLHSLICTITPYLDSQQKWREFAQHGLQRLLRCLCASMYVAVEAFLEQSDSQIPVHLMVGLEWYYNVLSQASDLWSSRPMPFPAESDGLTGNSFAQGDRLYKANVVWQCRMTSSCSHICFGSGFHYDQDAHPKDTGLVKCCISFWTLRSCKSVCIPQNVMLDLHRKQALCISALTVLIAAVSCLPTLHHQQQAGPVVVQSLDSNTI